MDLDKAPCFHETVGEADCYLVELQDWGNHYTRQYGGVFSMKTLIILADLGLPFLCLW